ncbi:MAG: 7-cyano-7-deazaguanine synthase QueC [Acetobacterium sp.]
MEKAIVLLSGGIDSTTCLAMAVDRFGCENVTALSIQYGQKHSKELDAAKEIAEYYDVVHIVKDMSDIFSFSDCSLLKGSDKKIEHSSYADQLEAIGGEGTVSTYVPFRNGLLLSFAAATAISIGAGVIYYGAHADDAAGRAYPDCTPEFEQAMNTAIYEGSGRILKMVAPLMEMNKAEVVKTGLSLEAPYQFTWSCYEGDEIPCGTCGTCIDRQAAFDANDIKDPAIKKRG